MLLLFHVQSFWIWIYNIFVPFSVNVLCDSEKEVELYIFKVDTCISMKKKLQIITNISPFSKL